MNIFRNNYDENLIRIDEPYTKDNENYYCKLTYNNNPFIVKTNNICKCFNKIQNDSLIISFLDQDYALWIENLYIYLRNYIKNISDNWFDEPLSFEDLYDYFTCPLKSSIKYKSYDLICSVDKNNTLFTDENGVIIDDENIFNKNMIPTLHFKGIKFNGRRIYIDIEVKNIVFLNNNEKVHNTEQITNTEEVHNTEQITNTEEVNNTEQISNTEEVNNNEEVCNTEEVNNTEQISNTEEVNNTEQISNTEEVTNNEEIHNTEEVSMSQDNNSKDSNDLEEVNNLDFDKDTDVFNINNNLLLEVYEKMNIIIKEDFKTQLKNILLKKKIKIKIDLEELFESDDEDSY